MLTPTLCYTSYNCNNDIKRKEIAVQVCDGSVHSRPSWCPTAERTALVLRGGGDAVTDYERERQEKLKKNQVSCPIWLCTHDAMLWNDIAQAMLASLGLSQGGATSLGINKPKKKPRPRRLVCSFISRRARLALTTHSLPSGCANRHARSNAAVDSKPGEGQGSIRLVVLRIVFAMSDADIGHVPVRSSTRKAARYPATLSAFAATKHVRG
eukprot:1387443-Rhodomonas_salina.4